MVSYFLYMVKIKRGVIFLNTLMEYLARFFVLFTAITVHEFAHGMAAYKLGDPTAKYDGRLTLNPLAHLDPMGALCMVFFKFGWAKPVPINPMYFSDRKRGSAITAAAGPLANIVLAFLVTPLIALFYVLVLPYSQNILVLFVKTLLEQCAFVNISFAVFNLIPFPPLDGSKILGAFLSTENYMRLLQYERYAFPVLILLSLTGVLGRILSVVIAPIYSGWIITVNGLIQLFAGWIG